MGVINNGCFTVSPPSALTLGKFAFGPNIPASFAHTQKKKKKVNLGASEADPVQRLAKRIDL